MVYFHRASKEKPGAGTYFLGVVIGLFLGYIFMQMPKWNAEITRDEATHIAGYYQACDVSYRKGRIHSISLILSNTDKLFIHQTCASEALVESLSAIPQDTEITLLIHPNSHNIMEIEVNGEILLDFEHSQELLSNNASGFFFLGIGMIAIAIYCAVNLIIEEIKLYHK